MSHRLRHTGRGAVGLAITLTALAGTAGLGVATVMTQSFPDQPPGLSGPQRRPVGRGVLRDAPDSLQGLCHILRHESGRFLPPRSAAAQGES